MVRDLDTIELDDNIKFLICCCETVLSQEDEKFIYSFINAEQFNMNTLIDLSNQHGILPLVHKTLKSLDSKHLMQNADIFSELKAHYMGISQRNMLMSAELIRIMNLLKDNSIESLAFKGPALSQMAYGDITLRQFGDLDILIRKKDIQIVKELLYKKEYIPIYELTTTQESIWLNEQKDFGLFNKNKNILIEIHWALIPEEYPIQLNLKDIWKNSETIKINNKYINTFALENLIFYLCIHGSKHLWERIEWIKDIDLLIQTQNPNWENIFKQVENSDFKISFYLGIYLSHLLFSTPIPKEAIKNIKANKTVLGIIKTITSNWKIKNEKSPIAMFQYKLTTYKLILNPIQRNCYMLQNIFKPSFKERLLFDLPKSYNWLYYFIRPYLLLKKYFNK